MYICTSINQLKQLKMENLILSLMLKKADVSYDLNLNRGHMEEELFNFYLYAVVADLENGYDIDVTFARKTSKNVSAETLELIPLNKEQETKIAHHILNVMDEAESQLFV